VVTWLIGIGVGLLILTAVGVALVRHLPESEQFEGVLLRDAQPSDAGFISAPVRQDLIGKTGVALSELRPIGTAEFDDERVDVTTDGEYIDKGTPVKVVRADNMKVVVRAAPTPPRLNA
jgi:membrane-bound serine protease (ClpP class)